VVPTRSELDGLATEPATDVEDASADRDSGGTFDEITLESDFLRRIRANRSQVRFAEEVLVPGTMVVFLDLGGL
jgi:hypothetical protein